MTGTTDQDTLVVMSSDAERAAIDRVTQRLSARFPTLAPLVVARVVRDTHRRFAAHPTREFVPILVEDAAMDALRVMPTTTAADRFRG